MHYLDHAATTPMRPVALNAWTQAAGLVGNPSSVHGPGRAARRLLEESREAIAVALGVPHDAVVFTGGGTEADNIALVGGFRARQEADRARRLVVHAPTEHKAVLEPIASLAQHGAEPVVLDVDNRGSIDLDGLGELLRRRAEEIALVTLMWANNETGSVANVRAVADLCARAGVQFHTDAVQALGNEPVDLEGVHTAAFSAHKVGGPKGVGVLVASAGSQLLPIVRGGGQESGLRPGTSDVAGAAAAAAAITEAVAEQAAHAERMRGLRDGFLDGLRDLAEKRPTFEFRLNSPPDGLAGLASVAFPGCDADALMMLLDAAGVAVSTGSACSAGIPRPSHVLTAHGSPYAASTLRISLGWTSTESDVDAVLTVLPQAVERARSAGAPMGAAR